MNEFDPEIMQDFLTESGELLEQLDVDLVSLESTPKDPDLLNKAFRALHTIKGSASFLALTNLVAIAHATEDALNLARKGDIVIDRPVMDLLLDAVDVLRRQFEQLEAGEPLDEASAELIEGLLNVGSGEAAPQSAEAPAACEQEATTASDAAAASGAEAAPVCDDESSLCFAGALEKPLSLPENKADLLDFMIDDLDETLEKLSEQIAQLVDESKRQRVADSIADVTEALVRSVDFFECEQMTSLVELLNVAAEHIDEVDADLFEQLLPRLQGVIILLRDQSRGLRERRLLTWPVDTLNMRITDLILGRPLEGDALLPENATAESALEIDQVRDDPSPQTSAAKDEPASALAQPEINGDAKEVEKEAEADASKGADKAATNVRTKVEQTIRIEVGRLEALLNLVGELVLQKNRVGALTRHVAQLASVDHEVSESLTQASSDLDRVTGDIQSAVMRARMQSLERLFGKYPRLIRDLSRKTGKDIELVIEGAETEVDKSVIEELGDPLIHLLRNSADHGIEMPEPRAQSNKAKVGTIRLRASQQGDFVLVQIQDDGAGLNRDVLIEKAVSKGLTTPEEAAQLSDREVFRFILAAGLSTAKSVSDLSGRGVGMDVVRTNIEKLKGTIEIDSTLGEGTTVSIRIPLTVAIMPAMMVGVGGELYAVPLTNIIEIVRPSPEQVSTVNNRRVMRIRNSVLPLVDLIDRFDVPEEQRQETEFAVIVELNEQRVGLLVSKLIGQQEIVIKPLDAMLSTSNTVSGATVRDDGGVSLIVDIGRLLESVRESDAAIAA